MRLVGMGAVLTALWGFVVPASAAGIVEYDLEAPSPTLGRTIPYAVYKPFPFPAEGERWPVVYLLHGLTGADGDWFTWGNLAPILDRAIADGRIPPVVVVAPGAGDSWYVDNPDPGGLGLIDTAFAVDLVAAIDASLPTAACREGRAIGGVSMGGAGAILQAINHPQTYVAAMSFSGALHRPMQPNDQGAGFLISMEMSSEPHSTRPGSMRPMCSRRRTACGRWLKSRPSTSPSGTTIFPISSKPMRVSTTCW